MGCILTDMIKLIGFDWFMQKLRLTTKTRSTLVDITADINRLVSASGVQQGLCLVFSPHTTAGITVQEGYDPDVVRDITEFLNRAVPYEGDYRHAEGNSDSHIKALMTGTSQTLPVEDGRLQLGRWQAVFFCEFDGPRERTVWVQLIESDKE
jgi:secondary thiamine-phosphate synthase enzyme